MGTVLGSARIPARHGNDAVIEDIVAVAHQAAGERFDEVRAIGVGTPGTVDSASGHVGNIVNLDVVSLDMGPLVSQRSGVPAHVENDVNAAAVGAATVLGGADGMAGTIAFLNFGTGLAAGIVENGVLMHGYSGAAGEIGISQSNLIASSALAGNTDAWKPSARAHPWTSVAQRRPADADLIRRAKKREAEAVDVLDMVVRAIGDTIQILAQSVDPRLIVLGGGMAKTGEPLVEVIAAELRPARNRNADSLKRCCRPGCVWHPSINRSEPSVPPWRHSTGIVPGHGR